MAVLLGSAMPAFTFLTVLLLASGVRASEVGQGSQRVEVLVYGVPEGHTLVVERGETASLVLEPDATGALAGVFLGLPRRSVHLLIREQGAAEDGLSWGSAVLLPQRGQNQVAFSWSESDEGPRVAFLSVHPTQTGRRALASGVRTNLALGWGTLVLGYLAVLLLAHLPSRKGSDPA